MDVAHPRRWTETIDGIRWLPRMIDKARMELRGALGAYLLGHSPVDKALLARLGLGTGEFTRIVDESPGDAEVLAALRRHPGFDEPRVRRWSNRFPRSYRALIPLWDIDEGYATPKAWELPFAVAYRSVERPVSALLRVILGRPG